MIYNSVKWKTIEMLLYIVNYMLMCEICNWLQINFSFYWNVKYLNFYVKVMVFKILIFLYLRYHIFFAISSEKRTVYSFLIHQYIIMYMGNLTLSQSSTFIIFLVYIAFLCFKKISIRFSYYSIFHFSDCN